MVIPIIAAFASAGAAVSAAGGFMAAMSTVSGFLSIAGAALTTIGALSGKKDLVKIGGFMSIGGGIGTAMNAAAGATAGATAGAGEVASGAQEAFRASEIVSQTGAGAQAAAPLADVAASAMSPDMASRAATDFGAQSTPRLYQSAGDIVRQNAGASPGLDNGIAGSLPSSGAPSVADPSLATPGVQSAIAKGAESLDSGMLAGYLKRGYDAVKPIVGGALDFASKNKELMSMGGNMLTSMYGPQAEEMDMRKSIYERRMRNLNSPVKLNYGGG